MHTQLSMYFSETILFTPLAYRLSFYASTSVLVLIQPLKDIFNNEGIFKLIDAAGNVEMEMNVMRL